MADKKKTEPKLVFAKDYIVPLRKGWLKVPKYKRANKAVKTLKEFLVRHMKVYDRDLRKIKLDIILNNELRFRGMRKPPAFIKVKARKLDDGIVRVELIDIPDKIKFEMAREEKKKIDVKKRVEEKKEVKERSEEAVKKEESEEEKGEDRKEEDKKEKDVQKTEEIKTKEPKKVSIDKGVKIQRKSLSR